MLPTTRVTPEPYNYLKVCTFKNVNDIWKNVYAMEILLAGVGRLQRYFLSV
jgi:hypothetical protein